MTGAARRRLHVLWGVAAAVVVALLVIGSTGGGTPTLEERARNLEAQVKCPTCPGQSVAQSDAASARGVKTVIRDQLDAGRTDEEIIDSIVATYGERILLDPGASGFSAVVWALPVAVVVVAVGGLVYRFRDWRPGGIVATAADHDLVSSALGESAGPTTPGDDRAASEGDRP